MKFFIILSVTTTLFFSSMFRLTRLGVRGQSFDDPTKHFEKFTFDTALRGSFNLSECVKELINCFELVRPDVICQMDYGLIYNDVRLHDTVCGHVRQYCHDYYGNYDSYVHKFTLYEMACRSDKDQHWT